MGRLIALTALTSMMAMPALAQGVVQNTALKEGGVAATSPDGKLRVTVTVDGDGRPHYAVARNGKPLIEPSRLGFLLTDAPKLERRFAIESQSTSSADSTWEQPWGEWKSIRDRHTEFRVRLKETTALARVMDVVFRIFDEGVGFRYEFPDQPNLKHANIADELTEFGLAGNGTAWWIPAGEWNRYEYLYNRTPISEVGQAHTPITVKLADGTHVAFHEAALVDYSSMWLRRVTGTRFKAQLSPGAGPAKVVKQGPFTTPWRTMVIADDAAGLYTGSRMTLNLNEPNKLGDVSWVKPGKFVGVWWNMIKGKWSWARGPQHGATTANVKRYIDFAGANGIPGVLVEGWNVGWDGDWFGNGTDMNFSGPTEDFDAAGLAAYAKSKGTALVGHHETGGSASHYDKQLDTAFAWSAAHGQKVVKTGYVADAGQIGRVDPDGSEHREWHDGQWMSNHHLRVVLAAAKYKISVDPHEPIKDTGLRRTYPNWLAREGARGQEYMAWQGKNPPEHEANLVFTRMLSGPMDFTPGILSLKGEKDSDIPSTIAKQLAQYVVIYSPVQMAADEPETYAKLMDAFQFIKDVPVDWADTRILNGEVGDYVTIARKDRNSADWYLGSVGDEQARNLEVTLDFLDPGKTYTAQIYRDAPDTRFDSDTRHKYVIESRKVKRGDKLTLALAPGGGQAIRFVAK